MRALLIGPSRGARSGPMGSIRAPGVSVSLMRSWLPLIIRDLLFPVVLAFILAILDVVPFIEGAVFFSTAEICCSVLRKLLPMPTMVAHLFSPIAAPVPAFLIVASLFPSTDILVMGKMALHYFIYLAYAAAMVYVMAFLEELLGLERPFEDPTEG